MKDLTWGKILIIVVGFLLTSILSDWLTSKYKDGMLETKVDLMEIELSKKPNNDVLLQWMKLSKAADDANKEDTKDLRERIIRIESMYINEAFRVVRVDSCTYHYLQAWLWEKEEWDFLAEYTETIYD